MACFKAAVRQGEEMGRQGVEYEPAVKTPKKKTKSGIIFLRVMEVLAIALSYFQSSAIVAFLTTKVMMDATVAITARFGADAGYRASAIFSGILASFVAEPRLIAVVITAVILLVNGIVLIIRGIHDVYVRGKIRKREKQLRLERKQEAMLQIEKKEEARRQLARDEFEAAAMERRKRALQIEQRGRK